MSEFLMKDYAAKAREAAADGIVLLENRDGALPLEAGMTVAVFGRSQFNYYKSGTGSGGLVNTGHVRGITEALDADEDLTVNTAVKEVYETWLKDHPFDAGSGWASEPWHQEEMPVSDDLIQAAAETSDAAVVILGRTAGEDQDNSASQGSWFLTDAEEELLKKVCGAFARSIVLLNVGNIIDMGWVDRYHPAAAAYVWQGGQEGAAGVLGVLKGTVTPGGKLPDTIPVDIHDIPSTAGFGDRSRAVYAEDIYVGYRYFETFARDKVRYPFGYGLSYTTFAMETQVTAAGDAAALLKEADDIHTVTALTVTAQVTNTGNVPGREVVQVYAAAPQGALGKAARSLCGFAKTGVLAPGASEILTIDVPLYALASYDDGGACGHKSCYVLEAGDYGIYVGTDVRSAFPAGCWTVAQLTVVEELTEALSPTEAFQVLRPGTVTDSGEYTVSHAEAAVRTADLAARIADEMPVELPYTGDLGIQLADVAAGRHSMNEFIGQFTDEDLTAITRGEGMCSPKVTPGIAGAFGGVTKHLKEMGIPVAGCSDGPSGIRMDCGTRAFSMPNGTLLASTFDPALCADLYEWEGLELRKNKIDMLLGPGMNIHRNPLNGRNFEYFSEDPFLTGKMAAAQLTGMHRRGVTGTIKHFAANNQETNRHGVEAIVSERALREIYLKGFEMAVREGHAYTIMSSYNPLNGFWTASNYDLLTTILRGEWGYDGLVMTDWWAKGNFIGEGGEYTNTGAKALAQNDVNMVNANAADDSVDNSMECLRSARAPRSCYQRSAANICRVILRTPVFARMLHGEDALDEELKSLVFEGEEQISRSLTVPADEAGTAHIPGAELDRSRGAMNLVTVQLKERGLYRLEVVCRARAEEGELSQLPLTITVDKTPLGTITLQGTEKDWKTVTYSELSPFLSASCYLKLYFGQAGMEIDEIRMVMTMSLEERIREAMAQRQAQ